MTFKFLLKTTRSSHNNVPCLNVILVPLALGRNLDSVPLGDDADVELEVALHPAARVVRVGEKRPLVVKLVICNNVRCENGGGGTVVMISRRKMRYE